MRRLPALLLAAATLPTLAALPASGQTTIITTVLLGDAPDHNLADGICDADAVNTLVTTPEDPDPDDDVVFAQIGQCTLRAAVQTANANAGADTITLRAARYALSVRGADDTAAAGDLDVTSDITINGQGYQISFIDGKKIGDRIFDVRPGGSLTLNDTALLYGKTPNEDPSGGCIRNLGATTLAEVFFYRCTAADAGGCVDVAGGTLDVTDSVFSGCRAKGEGGCVAVAGGASADLSRVTGGVCKGGTGGAVAARGTLSLRNATFTLNRAKSGGGVAVLGDGDATIVHTTLHANGSSNLLSQTTGTVDVTNTIAAGTKTDCVGPVTSGDGNLESGTSCGFTSPNDQQNQDPLLLPLAFGGGLVGPTAPLDDASPAIDHGLDPGTLAELCSDRDARELLRVARVEGAPAMVDVGAYESNAATSQTTIISVPIETATVGVLYEYDVDTGVVAAGTRVEKDRGACGTFSFVTNPAGMTIDGVTGEIAWTPGGGQTGAQAVTVRFVDPDGPTNVTQGFTIQVTAP